jgi:D-beta-D-heptose 7-phosphate kinase/D-beta-D-heptose 1-phosphate adenosyltransferase
MKIDLSAFDRCRLLVVGDVMLDHYLWGRVERISPEAPVPVLTVEREEFTLGGAANVAKNLAVAGARVALAGVVGAGPQGRRLKEELVKLGVEIDALAAEPGRPTTLKTRILAGHQQVLRVDRETTGPIARRSTKRLLAAARAALARADLLVISDYGKGVVSRELVAGLAEAARAAGKTAIADPKGRDYSKYAGLTLITPNRQEAALAAGIEITDAASLSAAAERILETAGVEKLLITCGKDGMVFFDRGRPALAVGTRARQVYDVSGAGDTVLAFMGLGLAAGLAYPEAIALANAAAGIVVGKVGTAAATRAELAEALQPSTDPTAAKLKSVSEMAAVAQELRRQGRRIVMTNGCFDLLHSGHIRLFSASRELGDVLIVAVDSDESVRRLKGPGRPVIRAAERVRILCALDSVDYVLVFSTEDLGRLLETIRPDVLAKGGNYAADKIIGREIVEGYGGRVAAIPVDGSLSSTGIIDAIRGGR